MQLDGAMMIPGVAKGGGFHVRVIGGFVRGVRREVEIWV
jgi:hypothetical protein